MLITSKTVGACVGQPTAEEIAWINQTEWNDFPPVPIDPHPTPEPEPEPDPEDCTHSGKQHTENAHAATCTEDGYTGDTVCDICHKVIAIGESIPMIPHTAGEGVVTKAPTLSSEGIMTYYCSECGAQLSTEVIPIPTFVKYAGDSDYTAYSTASSIPDYAFNDDSQLVEVRLGNNVTSIGQMAFCNCTALTSITLPDTLQSIGDAAFAYCNGLTSLKIPTSVTNIGQNVFISVSSIDCLEFVGRTSTEVNAIRPIEDIYAPEYVVTTDTRTFNTDGQWHSYQITGRLDTAAIDNTQAQVVNLVVGNNVTIVGNDVSNSNLFANSSVLKTVVMSDSVVIIENTTFLGCTSLIDVVISKNLHYSGYTSSGARDSVGPSYGLFFGCQNLPNYVVQKIINIYPRIEGISTKSGTTNSGECFGRCYQLSSLTIPSTVTLIGYKVFMNITNLAELIFEADDSNPVDNPYISPMAINGCANAVLKIKPSAVENWKNCSDPMTLVDGIWRWHGAPVETITSL